jgi:stearoyl-CoA desaturase (delta-9 desaturase)
LKHASPAVPEKYRDLPLPEPRPYEGWLFLPIVALHLVCLGALWTGTRPIDWVVCAVLYFVRIFGVMAGYHRYFAHRTFKTGRVFQCVLAVLAETSVQKGVLWWAAHHRNHHKFTDLPWDTHSPIQTGFWHAHMMWLAEAGSEVTRHDRIRDLSRFPELRWLNKWWAVPPILLAVAVGLSLGWSGLFVGFFLSTVLVLHATFLVNSLAHMAGKRRFATADTSRNSWLLALFTLGEGWHNNHHHHMNSARQGFYWWEIDVTYYVLRMLEWCGVVRELRPVPATVLADGRARDAAARALP